MVEGLVPVASSLDRLMLGTEFVNKQEACKSYVARWAGRNQLQKLRHHCTFLDRASVYRRC